MCVHGSTSYSTYIIQFDQLIHTIKNTKFFVLLSVIFTNYMCGYKNLP